MDVTADPCLSHTCIEFYYDHGEDGEMAASYALSERNVNTTSVFSHDNGH